MYEDQTFESILQRMLARVPNTMDKREGSIIYDALAPAAMELAQMYTEFDVLLNLSFADTATGEYLARRTAEMGITRLPATKARRKGLFYGNSDTPLDVPITSRFSLDNTNYSIVERIAAGEYVLECETPGTIGNQSFGVILPVDFIKDLARAELADILVPGEDIETDDNLRKRYFDSLESRAYGGNIADYQQKVKDLQGVGGVKVYPVWSGGGTVKLIIIDSDFNAPSPALIDNVQTAIDPEGNQGEGLGIAPIGHVVTVEGVENIIIDVETTLSFQGGYTWEDVKPGAKEAINGYFAELRSEWADNTNLVVRISQLETRMLNVNGVLDIFDTKINGLRQNLVLGGNEIPVPGEVTTV
ncbi:baseplate J/gp47 family protein [Desulfotomaculum sp. 1211_IL3151]|uniref:baseplate J/gp47 family protein n=1 Tax=Desulfotomaculum sp. 1211_IL3151 TaxID=3084055 RepID=UPI002FD9EF0B